MDRLRLAFLGTPDFAVPALKALAAVGHDIACVYTQPPRPAGRGRSLRRSPVHVLADSRGWPVRTPTSLATPEEQQAFVALEPDAAVVVAYGLILPQEFLDVPRLGCLNIHPSLLPRWRGAAPIQRAILAGDRETGVTIMEMDAGLDSGPILLRQAVPIDDDATAADLHDRLAELGARLIVEALEGVSQGSLSSRPQPERGVTYAAKLGREEGRLDWTRSAADLERQVRAFTPWPGAWFEAESERIKVLSATVVEATGIQAGIQPGTLLDEGFAIACGDGALRLRCVQRAGKAAMEGAAFLRGFALAPGAVLT